MGPFYITHPTHVLTNNMPKSKNKSKGKKKNASAEGFVQFAETLDFLKSEGDFKVANLVQSAYQEGTIFKDDCRVVMSRQTGLVWKKFKGSGPIAVPAALVAAIEETQAKHPERKLWKPTSQKNRVPRVWFASYAGKKLPNKQEKGWEKMICSRTCQNLWCVHPPHLCWEKRRAAELRRLSK